MQLPKRLIPDVGNAGGDGDGGQTRTALERIEPDTGYTVRNRNAGQAQAVRELPEISVTLLPIVTLVRLLHHPNAPTPRLVTLFGIVTLVRPQRTNAHCPMFVTLLGW